MSDWDDHEAHVDRANPTRYTTCWYCPRRLPLREIAEHARVAHPKESLRYRKCWHCGVEVPLNQIRAHGRTCRPSVPAGRRAPRHRAEGPGAER